MPPPGYAQALRTTLECAAGPNKRKLRRRAGGGQPTAARPHSDRRPRTRASPDYAWPGLAWAGLFKALKELGWKSRRAAADSAVRLLLLPDPIRRCLSAVCPSAVCPSACDYIKWCPRPPSAKVGRVARLQQLLTIR